MITNNVTRMLDAKKVTYTAFELPEEKLGALEAAEVMHAPPQQVFKTIVVTRYGSGKPVLAVVPGPLEVDLKALARTLGEKKLRLPTQREAERLTGLQAGGISALALIKRGFEVVLDKAALAYQEIYVSGGQRGLDIRLPVQAFVDLTRAKIAPVSRKS